MKAQRLAKLLIVCMMLLLAVAPAWAVTSGEPDGNDHPYVGLVALYDAEGTYIGRCSGTLLSSTVVLTAGHCTFDAASARVYFEPVVEANLREPGNTGYLGTTVTHPEYANFAGFPNTHDLGLILLDESVETETIGELAEPNTLDALATKRGQQETTFDVVGYGLQSVKPKLQADRVRYQGTVQFVNLRSALTDGFNLQHSGSPGKGTGGAGTCFGDSGGPVFLPGTNIIVAVTSFGLNSNCAGPGFAYRVDIEESLEFINQYLTNS